MSAGLVLSDLDRTLVWSRRTWDAGPGPGGGVGPLVCVEELDGAEHAFVTAAAYDDLVAAAATGRLVWVTTRTPDQLARLRLPATPYALCLNAGRLLVDGLADEHFSAATATAVAAVTPLPELTARLRPLLDVAWVRRLRDADGLFCYLLLDRDAVAADAVPEPWWEQVAAVVAEAGWVATRERTKVYATPAPLTKGAGVARLLECAGAPLLAAAGDSLLDADMLALAGHAMVPRGSYLDHAGWTHPSGTRTGASGGPLAGEEVAAWLLVHLRT